jgi:hypothetical protein
MTTATATAAPTTDADSPRGWPGLRCPYCGNEDCVSVALADGALRCAECDDDLDRGELRRHAERWLAALAWLDALPPATPASAPSASSASSAPPSGPLPPP